MFKHLSNQDLLYLLPVGFYTCDTPSPPIFLLILFLNVILTDLFSQNINEKFYLDNGKRFLQFMFYIGRNLCTPCLPFYYLFFAMSFLRLFFLYKLSLYTEQPGGLTSLYLHVTCFHSLTNVFFCFHSYRSPNISKLLNTGLYLVLVKLLQLPLFVGQF